ncbi:hypothetical protein M9H77_27166 [Catharanthus roseus]|uniref:Uncharacterized protein n=1 Tax=Catharanthus roseus TaxID=4058 RepID=A0ACC0AG05_CATRO|nr:hypothetical protein M9H77_27166 [Catharanthus roseus]
MRSSAPRCGIIGIPLCVKPNPNGIRGTGLRDRENRELGSTRVVPSHSQTIIKWQKDLTKRFSRSTCPSKMETMKRKQKRKPSTRMQTYHGRCLLVAFVCDLIFVRLDNSQGCLEFKKEEQSRQSIVVNWGNRLEIRHCTFSSFKSLKFIALIIWSVEERFSSKVPLGDNVRTKSGTWPFNLNIHTIRQPHSKEIGKEEQAITFPMFINDDDETAQESEESTSQGFQEPLPNLSEVEERLMQVTRVEQGGEETSHGVQRNENAKREQSLCYEKARMSFSSTLALTNLLFSFKELNLFEFYIIFLKLDFKIFISRLTWDSSTFITKKSYSEITLSHAWERTWETF